MGDANNGASMTGGKPAKIRRLRTAVSVAACLCLLAASSARAAVDNTTPGTKAANVSDLVDKAQAAMKNGHPEVAVIYLKNAEALSPNAPDIHLNLGEALLAVGKSAVAEAELNIALGRGIPAETVMPFVFQAMLDQREELLVLSRYPAPASDDRSELAMIRLRGRAAALAQAGRMAEAVATLDRSLAISRTTANLAARARLAAQTGDSGLANNLIDEAMKKDPSDQDVLSMKVALLQAANQPEKALAVANDLLTVTNGMPRYLLTRAIVYLQLEENAKAEADLDTILKIAPYISPAIYYKAVVRSRANDVDAAYGLVMKLRPAFINSRADIGVTIGQIAIDAGQPETGADILHNIVELYPTDMEARIHLARAQIDLNTPTKAIDTLLPLQNSTEPRVMALLAQAYDKQKNPDLARKYAVRAVQGGLGSDAFKLHLAAQNLQNGDLDYAQRLLEQLNAGRPNQPDVIGLLIDLLLREGNIDAATKKANDFAKAVPQSPFVPLFRARILTQKGDIDGAIAACASALARDAKFLPALINRGKLLAMRGDLQAAQTDLQSALAVDPKNADAAIALAQVLRQSGQDGKATAILAKASGANPGNFPLVAALVQQDLAHNRAGDALKRVQSLLRVAPDNEDALILQGNLQLTSGAIDQALVTFRQLRRTYPDHPEPAILLAQAYMKKGDKISARDALVRFIITTPKTPAPHLALVQQDMVVKNDAALYDANNFVAQAPGAIADQTLALVLTQMNKSADAEQVLRKSLTLSPNPQTVIQLSVLLRGSGRAKEANDILAGWLAKYPDDQAARFVYGMALMPADGAGAEKQFRALLARQPYNLSALNNMAWLVGERDPAAGLPYATLAQKIAPTDASVLDTAGWIRWRLKDQAAALDLLTRAHAGAPADPETAYHLAVALNGAGRPADARKILSVLLANGTAFADRELAKALSNQLH
jgi:putative PEP-CTERM system TPR-repeat lipoprotein